VTISIGLLYDVIRWEEKALIKAAKDKGINITPIDTDNLSLSVKADDGPEFGDVILQRCVGYYRAVHLTAILQGKGKLVINPLDVALTCGNKLLTTLALMNANVPTPKTIVAFSPESALRALDNKVGYPAVLKPVTGSWGRLVALLNDRESAEAILEDRSYMFPLYQIFYVQPKVDRPPRDIRSVVIGDEVVAAIYRYSAPGQWKTNTALGGKAVACPITRELEDVSLKAAKAVGGGVLGIDCMESPDGLLVHEVNNTVEFKNTVPTTGVNIQGLIIDYAVSLAKR
jgi:[lysine-biosynthesis-protein LysW]--L-2-aminoadipate ligase